MREKELLEGGVDNHQNAHLKRKKKDEKVTPASKVCSSRCFKLTIRYTFDRYFASMLHRESKPQLGQAPQLARYFHYHLTCGGLE